MADNNRCEQCQTHGITLLPSRNGYAAIENNINIYSRLVREGYIYILDNNEEWYGYVVTQGRYFKQFNVSENLSSPDLPIIDYSCNKGDDCAALSSFIRIPNPSSDIVKLWLVYSPVKWTSTVLKRHKNNKNGAKKENMIELPVSITQSKSKESLGERESQNGGGYDFWQHDSNEEGDESFSSYLPIEYFNYLHPFTEKIYTPNKSKDMQSLADKLYEIDGGESRVLTIYFNDPIGELIDLNDLIIEAQLASRPTQDEAYRHTVATLIDTLKNNIDEKTKTDAQRHIDRVNQHTELLQPMPRWEGDGPSAAEQQAENKRRQEGASSYLERQRQSAWSSYSNFIRESEMNNWIANFEATSKQRQNKLNGLLDNLSTAYKKVFESERLKNTMIHCFDKDDEASCVYYTLTVQQFLGSTATIPMLADFYESCLSTKAASDEDNYLALALVFNQDQVVEHIDGLSPITTGLTSSESMTASWSGLLYTGSASIFAKYDAIANQVGATVSLAEQLAVPFMKNYRTGQTLSGLMISQKEYLFGYHHEKALVIVKGQGTYADARKALMNGVMNVVGSGSLPTRIRESVDQALKTSGELTRLNKPFAQSFIYYIDKNELKAGMNVYQSGNKAYADKGALRRVIDSSVFTTPELFDQGYKDYKRFEDITNRKIDQAVRANYFGAMLQTVACVFLVSAFFQAKSQEERLVEGSKAAAGLMMLLAGSLELRGNASKLLESELKLQRGAGAANLGRQIDKAQSTAKSLSTGARMLSLGGAAIFAGFDLKAGYDAGQNDNYVVGIAYGGSAVTGLASTYLLAFTAFTGVGVVVLIAFIGINLFIGYWVKTGMENWLKHGIWGKDSNNWSLKHTLEQFDRAVVGEDIDLKDD